MHNIIPKTIIASFALGTCVIQNSFAELPQNDDNIADSVNDINYKDCDTISAPQQKDDSFINEISIAVANAHNRIEHFSCLHKIYQQSIPNFEYYNYNLIAGIIDIFFLNELDKFPPLQLSKICNNNCMRYNLLKEQIEALENINDAINKGYPSYIADIAIEHLRTEIKMNNFFNTDDQTFINDLFNKLTNINGIANGIADERNKLQNQFLNHTSVNNILFNKFIEDLTIFGTKYGPENLYKQVIDLVQKQILPPLELLTPIFNYITEPWLEQWKLKHLPRINDMINDITNGIENTMPDRKWANSQLNSILQSSSLETLQFNWDTLKHKWSTIYTEFTKAHDKNKQHKNF